MTASVSEKNYPAPLLLPAIQSDISSDLLFRLYFPKQSAFKEVLILALDGMINGPNYCAQSAKKPKAVVFKAKKAALTVIKTKQPLAKAGQAQKLVKKGAI
jgi:hypothetical protein